MCKQSPKEDTERLRANSLLSPVDEQQADTDQQPDVGALSAVVGCIQSI